MVIQNKKLKKESRSLAGKAYERLLNKALRELDADFSEWRAGKIDPWELSDRIHKFHDGISRRLYVLAGHNHGQTILSEAILQGEIPLEDLSAELKEYLRPSIESLKSIREESNKDTTE